MSKGKQIGGEAEESDVCKNDSNPHEKGLLGEDSGNSFWIISNSLPPKRFNSCETNGREDDRINVIGKDHNISKKEMLEENFSNAPWNITHNSPPPENISTANGKGIEGPSWYAFWFHEGGVGGSSNVEPQDADYSQVPQLSDEVENQILARVPRSEYWKFPLVNKRILGLMKSGELFKIRRELGVKESSVFIFATGDSSWWAFDRQFSSRRKLPDLPADSCFYAGDKESLCAGWGVAFKSLGNELLVIGASTSIVSYSGDGMAIYTCCPDTEATELQWRPLECGRNRLSNFILNCSVMVA
ncbi:hypothetical protein JCGZ_10129 [Jatropha curcas]|uniref:Uncharacterized protein n=1 Tax=Jatropha curcas TaxID=180498 RepID=A0A067LP76_JATCU|nr:hypothetical protein JCGZ_10129 [Jatropha curcas]